MPLALGSLYLLKEAGALLAGGVLAEAFSGGASSPRYMPTLPWSTSYRNEPGPIERVPLMTDYRGEAGMLSTEGAGWMDEAGSPVPSGIRMTQAQWDALSPAAQTAYEHEIAVRQAPAMPAITSSSSAPSPCPPGYINLGGGEFPNNCVPAHTMTMTRAPSPAPPIQSPPAPAPPITYQPGPPSNLSAPPADLLPPSGGGGGGGSIPWGPLAAGGIVLALIYAGRQKKKRRR